MNDIGLLVAFVAGVLALLSPCSALLLPSFFAYAFSGRSELLLRTGGFYLGLLLTLVPLGVGVGAFVTLFYGHRQLLVALAGWSLVVLGVVQLLGATFRLPGADRVAAPLRGLQSRVSPTGLVGVVTLGGVYGLAGFCSGPVLGSILTLAATRASVLGSAFLLAVYALGMAAPLFALALVWDRHELGKRRWVRGRELRVGPLRVHSTGLVAGLLFVGVGVLFLAFDGTAGITGTLGVGDTTGWELAAQGWVQHRLGALPGWLPPAGVALVAGLVVVRRRRADRGHGFDAVRRGDRTGSS